MNEPIRVEVLTASGCSRCQAARELVREVLGRFPPGQVQYRELNVVEHIDYAVQLGVLRTPAIAIDGVLTFTAMPSPRKLQAAIEQRLAQVAEGSPKAG